MNEQDLDKSYTALCEAISRVGPERAQLLLAMVSLSLMAHAPDAEDVLARIASAEARLAAEAERKRWGGVIRAGGIKVE